MVEAGSRQAGRRTEIESSRGDEKRFYRGIAEFMSRRSSDRRSGQQNGAALQKNECSTGLFSDIAGSGQQSPPPVAEASPLLAGELTSSLPEILSQDESP